MNPEQKNNALKLVKEYLYITAGTLLVIIGVYFFKFPNNFSIGGVTGLAIIVSNLLNGVVTSGNIVFACNMVLLVVGYIMFGKSFGIKTTYASILLSVGLNVCEKIFPMSAPLTDEPVLELFFAVLLPGLGAAILFNLGCSTGGTDIVAMILKKFTNLNIGQALLASDILLTLATFPVFGLKTGFLSVTGLILKSLVVDNIIETLNLCKYMTVISDNPAPICDFITKELNRSATLVDAKGAFTDKNKKVILTVMSRTEAVKLQTYIKEIEPTSFILITNTSEIIGRGFRRGY